MVPYQVVAGNFSHIELLHDCRRGSFESRTSCNDCGVPVKGRHFVFTENLEMAYNNGGGWNVQPGFGGFTGSAACYAGDGCTYIPQLLPNPLAVTSPEDLRRTAVENKACFGARVSSVSGFLDGPEWDWLCQTPNEGAAIYCHEATNLFTVRCGTGALFVLNAEGLGGGPQITIEQNSLVGFAPVTGRAITNGPFTDGECIVQNNIATCAAGWTYITIWPANVECNYNPDEDCDISCQTSEGFEKFEVAALAR